MKINKILNMKNLVTYINENVDFEIIKTEYREYGVVTLVRHENIDCSSISKDEFIKLMSEDLNKAIEEYSKIVKPINDKTLKSRIEYEVKKAEAFAIKKWKTQKKRDEYIEIAKKNAAEKKWYLEDPKRIFFDFKPNKLEMGISQDCILTVKTDDRQLERCYDNIKDDKYFKRATGWAFKYESRKSDEITTYAFRPYIDLLLDESSREEQKRDEETLTQAVNNFYKDVKYWGD